MSESASEDAAEISGTAKEGYERVMEGYVRYNEVEFEWYKHLNPWHVSEQWWILAGSSWNALNG